MRWFRVVAALFVAIDGGSLPRLEYVLAENRILREQVAGGMKLADADWRTLAEVGK